MDDRRSSLSLLSVFDGENYDRFRLVQKRDSTWEWANEDVPFTLDELMTMYGQTFRPLNYTRLNPFHAGDTLYSFEAHSYNASSLCCVDRIQNVYPNATDPGTDPKLWTEDDLTYDYAEPLPKYYE